MKAILIFISTIFFTSLANAQRIITSFDSNWFFIDQPDSNAVYELDWKPVTTPHTWNLDAYVKKEYKRGTCWYRKSFSIPDSLSHKEIYLRFDAVNSYAEVYLNGQLLTKHSGGYSAFQTHLPKPILKASNTLTVLVDNRNIDIPPLSGDFTIFGGIYRNVWMIAVEKEHFDLDNYGSPGIFISTPMVTRNMATMKIKGVVSNTDKERLTIQMQLIKGGKTVATGNVRELSGNAWEMNRISIKNPQLWSPDSPNLYRAHFKLVKGSRVVDELNLPVGFRWFSADTKNGFMLNGAPLKLMGTNRHQDEKPFGIAVPQWVHENDMHLIKRMGANFVRLAHYQQDDLVLHLCDSLGLIVWEEIPVVDKIALNETFRKNAESQLMEMIRQHYNHPSVVFWGIMNEAIIQVQYGVPKEQQPLYFQKTVALAKELEHLLKQEDNSRLSVMACHGTNLYNEIGLAGITDVLGWNLYQGWYSDQLSDFEKYTDEQHVMFPDRPIIISEFGAGSDKRLHSLRPKIFDFSIAYQQKLLEHYLPQIMKHSYIIGATEWNFIDFNVATRQESMPRTNNKGLVYNDRIPKDVYYYFQSFLRKDTAMVHIASDDWKLRDMVNDGDSAAIPVKVYSNQPQVWLIVNGEKLEEKTLQNFSADWKVRVPSGVSEIEAVALNNGEVTARDTLELTTRFTPFFTWNDTGRVLAVAINVGSNCSFYDAEQDITWHADKPYTTGSWGYEGGTIFRKTPGRIGTTAEISGTHDDPLYQTMREGLDGYRMDATVGKYEIELRFADLYNAPATQVYDLSKGVQNSGGLNVFDIFINDSLYLKDFCPYIESSNKDNTAVSRKIIFENTTGSIKIAFHKKSGHSFLNAILFRRL